MIPVDPPGLLDAAPPVLGALGPGLRRLAELQGAWPPRAAQHARTPAPGAGLEQGTALADAAADEGVDLLVVESSGDPSPALAVLAALLAVEPVHAIGTGGGPGWAGQVTAVRTALPRLRPLVGDPAALLDAAGDPALSCLAGLVAQAARRRTPVLLGSAPGAAAALLVADRLAPGAGRWVLAGCSSATPAAVRALEVLGVSPLLDLRLPGPGGALLAERVLAGALELLHA